MMDNLEYKSIKVKYTNYTNSYLRLSIQETFQVWADPIYKF